MNSGVPEGFWGKFFGFDWVRFWVRLEGSRQKAERRQAAALQKVGMVVIVVTPLSIWGVLRVWSPECAARFLKMAFLSQKRGKKNLNLEFFGF
jgi:hypothetical protein